MTQPKKYSSQAEIHAASIENPEAFWMEEAQKIKWFEAPEKALTTTPDGFYKWYAGGKLNTCYLALDQHIEAGRGGQDAIIYDSPVSGQKIHYTFKQAKAETAKIAGMLLQKGVQKGDTVVIYMPMIPQAVFAMLACARIGAIHSVVFGGFAPNELAVRIDHAKPKVVLTASCGIEYSKQIPYYPLLTKALSLAGHSPDYCLIYQREMLKATLEAETHLDWQTEVEQSPAADHVPLDSNHPLYILYTSGTTGKPKGVVRENGGHAVAMRSSMEYVYDCKAGDVYWAASDIGWAVGHSYTVYGPLISGCTTILFEGKPIKTPDAGTFWRIIEEHKVNVLFTAPTGIRAIRKEDAEGAFIQKRDLSSLRYLFVAGERCDEATYLWAKAQLQIPVIDHWWQTESGWPMAANLMGVESLQVKPGSACKPVFGYAIDILDKNGEKLAAGEEGNVCVKLPLPPGCLPTLWKDPSRFRSAYLNTFEGYYLSGDSGYMDKEGYLYIMGRIDDIINVAGHRLSTGEIEEVVAAHQDVAECAVIGIADELRGQVPIGLIVKKNESQKSNEAIEKELIQAVRNEVGAVAAFKRIVVVERLPKTRSGKTLRKALRFMADGIDFPTPPTIDDPAILDEIRAKMEAAKVGVFESRV